MTTYLPSMNKKDDIYFLILHERIENYCIPRKHFYVRNKNLSKFHCLCWNEFDSEIQATLLIPNSFLITSKERVHFRGCTIKKRKKKQ